MQVPSHFAEDELCQICTDAGGVAPPGCVQPPIEIQLGPQCEPCPQGGGGSTRPVTRGFPQIAGFKHVCVHLRSLPQRQLQNRTLQMSSEAIARLPSRPDGPAESHTFAVRHRGPSANSWIDVYVTMNSSKANLSLRFGPGMTSKDTL